MVAAVSAKEVITDVSMIAHVLSMNKEINIISLTLKLVK